ncbi:MAG: carbon monoxide dehydrogenase [Rhodobacteraceae bacterium]|nr:carbon monoxide dehydrogenase [Paracoccaceae bacterium]
MLEQSYNAGLVVASVAISMMAAFTGLWLTRGLSRLGPAERQLRIAMGAVALGDGIWSMHFIAMLAVRLPIPVTYDVLSTLASLLVVILLSGIALLIMHFTRRKMRHIVLSGVVLGTGIVVMHYTGMSAVELCRPVYGRTSVVAAGAVALVMGVVAIWAAYGHRTRRNILLGTVILGSAVVVVHFTAMAGTGFYEIESAGGFTPTLDHQELALIVLVSAFVICGAFLLSGATFLAATPDGLALATGPDLPVPPPEVAMAQPAAVQMREETPPLNGHLRIPVERRGHTEFVECTEIAALRAEGHYTIAYCCEDKFFCPWSISEAERRLAQSAFLRVHRSYLINVTRISGFERQRDGGAVCLFADVNLLERVPVSRSKVSVLRDALGL